VSGGRLTTAELATVEARVARLPVQQADDLLDKAFHASGVAWLRRNGWTRPVDMGDQRQRCAS
jgi:hypothetical protein